MNYKEASASAKQKEYLIGKKFNGATIDKIIVCPTSPHLFEQFSHSYLRVDNETI